MGAAPSTDGLDDRYRVLVLSTRRGRRPVVVGGLIIELDSPHEFEIDAGLLEPIAAALLDADTRA